jgi:hypothetical protein
MREQTDRRAAERFPVNTQTSCSFASPVVENFGPAKIKNISMDGIGVLLTRPVEKGSLLALTLSNPGRSFNKTVFVRVVHVTPDQPGAYLVGGTFTTPLPYEELSALVL